MKRIIFSLLVFIGCINLSAQIVSDADNALLDKIKQGNASMTSIASKFTQKKYMPIFDEEILSAGDFYYARPDKLAMWYTNPEGDLMLMSDDKFVMIAAGRRNETTSKNAKMRSMKMILAACIEGDVRRIETTTIVCEETATGYVVTADLVNGKNNKSNIAGVVLKYDKKDYSISSIQTNEPDGTYTVYELNNKKLNQQIADVYFDSSKK